MHLGELSVAVAQGPRRVHGDRVVARPDRLVVCDGLGGHPDGDRAAEVALTHLATADLRGGEAAVRSALVVAGNAVLALGTGDRLDPGTAAVLATLHQGRVLLGWCGDSIGCVVQNAEVIASTVPHVHPSGGIERCLGANLDTDPDVFGVPATVGDRVVVCSDGVTAALGSHLGAALGAAADAADLLRRCAAAGLADNTVIAMGTIVA